MRYRAAAGGNPGRVQRGPRAGGDAREDHRREFQVQEAGDGKVPKQAIVVGPGAAARALFPEVALDKLGSEELVMRVKGGRLLLAGGRPRGTLYAVYRFLQDQCGVRWWAPWATTIPHSPSLRVPALDVRSRPAFEYREPFWWAGFDAQWKAHNGANGENHPIPEALGGCIKYKGFCSHLLSAGAAGQVFRPAPRMVQPHQRQAHARERPALPLQPGAARLRRPAGEGMAARGAGCQDYFGDPKRLRRRVPVPQCKAIDDAEGSPPGAC